MIKPDISAYRRAVSDEMRTVYGLDWTDACGDDAPLERAWTDNLSAAEFVRWFGEKYGMQPRDRRDFDVASYGSG
jgi:hypothetical protein